MNLRRSLPWVALAVLAGFLGFKLHSSHFDWQGFLRSWRAADFRLIALAILVIYCNFVLRALRWSVFLRPGFKAARLQPVPWTWLVGSQFIGFTGLALFGRIGELIRPLLVARRTRLGFPSQVAVVAVERVFDLGAFALIFSLNLLLAPALQMLPYHERFHTVGYAIAGLTALVASVVALVRLGGNGFAAVIARLLGRFSQRAGASAAAKVLAFRDGLNVIDTVPDFLLASALSVALWLTIACSYVISMKAFPAPVHNLTVAHTLVLMGFSVVGSLVQLPGVGGGAQVGTITALTLLFGIPKELAISAGLMLWLVTTMSVIPAGLVFARLEGVSIRQTAQRSEASESEQTLIA